MMPPEPPVQLRQMLATAKRQGTPFELAWRTALTKVRWPHDTSTRLGQKAAIAEMEWAFRRGYHDQDVPGGRVALALADLFEDENHDPNPRREPPQRISSAHADEKARRAA